MVIPRYDEFMKPLLELLRDQKIHTMKELRTPLAEYFHLTQEDLEEMLPSGRQSVFLNRIGWAKTYLVKAGLLESPIRASCRITPAGMEVLKEAPPVIDKSYLLKFDSFREFIYKTTDHESAVKNEEKIRAGERRNCGQERTPDDQFEEAYQAINDSLAEEILEEVLKVPPVKFEKMVLDLLLCMGYGSLDRNYTTKASGDGGIDGVIMQDKLGFSLIYMQAKRWDKNQTVGRPVIQSFVGAIAKKDGKGLFVTTAHFSEEAKQYAAEQHIILIDGSRLSRLMIDHNFCVSVKKIFEVKAIDSDAFGDYQEE